MEGVKLQLPLLAEDDMVGSDHEQRAHKLLLDLLDVLIVHVQGVVMGDLVDKHLVGELHRQAVAINGNLLHIILATDANLLLRDEVLDDDIRHHVAVSVPVLVQAVHGGEDHLVHHHGAIVAAHDNIVLPRPHSNRPNPILALAQLAEEYALSTPELHLLRAAPEHKVVSIRKEIDATGVEVETVRGAVLLAGDFVERERLVPATDDKDIARVRLRGHRVPREAPDRSLAVDVRLLHSELVADTQVAAEETERQVQTVIRPRHGQNLGVHLVLRHRLLLRRPEAQVRGCAARKLLGHGVVRKALNGLVVVVLQDPLSLVGPDDHLLVRATRRKLLAMLRVGDAEDAVLVAL
mmetsp:Transcript_118085/g.252303  ORF Transcript_118085/g.252303 Transcript_118085/m.252303 type:complete len:351 (+) Transcript_118085:2717-3769(+)